MHAKSRQTFTESLVRLAWILVSAIKNLTLAYGMPYINDVRTAVQQACKHCIAAHVADQ